MANTLKIKRSSISGKVPLTTDLQLGELAVNTYDGKLFLKKDVGGVESIVDVSAGIDANGILTLLKTVDGSGSGLDADLVEGMHAVSTNTVNSIVARDASGNFSAGTITAALSGNASTATKLATARTISLTGDVTGSVSFDGSADASITATIAANSVALGTDTTGNYVADVTAGSYITKSGTAGEGWSPTIAVDATSANTASKVVARDASGNFSAGTITAALSGNASTATTLQTARTINGVSFNGSANINVPHDWVHSNRDFPNGTLIETTIDYSVTNGDPWVLEIRGNSYGNLIPFEIQYQGYIYSDTVINHGGYSVGTSISGLVLFNYNGKLCFWFPNQSYWHGYYVKVYSAYATYPVNKVTSISNLAKPSPVTKEVALSANIRQVLHSSNYNSYSPTLTGTGASGTWGINVTGNASTVTNGIYTTGSYTDPAWITSINYSKLTGTVPTWNQNTTGSAAKWTTARTLSFTGDATGSGSVDGSANVETALTLANSGVTAGTYTKITVDAKGRATSGTTLASSDIPNLDASKITTGVLDAARLPSYVDDVLEYVNLAGFPVTGETGKIYVALDTNKTYRWSGSTYVYITSGAVDSVAGKTGVVTLVKGDVGLGNVDNTSDANKNVLSATKLTTARTISLTGDVTGSVSFDGSGNAAIATTIAADSVALGTDTTGNYVASVATTAPLAGGAIGSEGGALTLSLASGYGDTQNPYASKTANTFLAAPNGTAGAPTFRAIVAADIPTLNQNTTGSAATLTTARTLTIGSTGKTFNGSANVSWSHSELGTTRNFGYVTVQGVVGSNLTCTTDQFITWLTNLGAFSQTTSVMKCTWDYAGNNDISDTGFGTLEMAGCVIETFGDTGSYIVRVTSPSTGTGAGGIHEYVNHGASYSPGWRRVYTSNLNGNITGSAGAVAWSGVTSKPTTLSGYGITDAAPSSHVGSGGTSHANATTTTAGFMSSTDKSKLDGIASGATANTGTVTSVGGTGTVSGLSLSGTVTTSGNLTLSGTLSVTPSNFASQTANTVLAAPNGTAGTPTFRALVAADIPTLNQDTTGDAGTVDGKSIGTLTAAGGILYATSTTAIAGTAAGTSGQVLTSGAAGAPTWTNQASIAAGSADTVAIAADTASTGIFYVPYASATTGDVALKGTRLTVQPSTGNFTAAGSVTGSSFLATTGGDAANPVIRIANDTNTGIYSPAADTIGFTTAGTAAMTLDSSGNTNISGVIGVKEAVPSTSAAITSTITDTVNASRYGINNTLNLSNTTLTADRSTYAARNINSSVYQNAAAFTLNQYGAYNQAVTDATSGNSINGEGALIGSYNYALHQSDDVTYTRMENAYGSYNYAYSSGDTSLIDNAFGSYNYIRTAGTSASASVAIATGYGNYTQITAGAANRNITTAYGYYLNATETGTITTKYGLYINPAWANYIAGGLQIGGTASSANTSGLTVTGAITASGNITANSDESLKTNWRPVQDDFVAKLALVKSGVYDRTDMELTQAGVSAQSLQKVLPETVQANDEGILSVAYGNAALVSAVELAKEVVSLKAEVAELKDLVANLLNTSKEQ